MTLYHLIYWLPNQSKLFSEPQHAVFTNKEDFAKALMTATLNRYEIEKTFTEEGSKA